MKIYEIDINTINTVAGDTIKHLYLPGLYMTTRLPFLSLNGLTNIYLQHKYLLETIFNKYMYKKHS